MAKNPVTLKRVQQMIKICEGQVGAEDQFRLAKFFKALLPEGPMRSEAEEFKKRAGYKCRRGC